MGDIIFYQYFIQEVTSTIKTEGVFVFAYE